MMSSGPMTPCSLVNM